MKRGLLIFAGLLLALCVGCAFLGYFVAVPRFKHGVETGVQEAVSTYVVPEIAGAGIAPTAGTYTLTEDAINRQLEAGGTNLQDMRFAITPNGLELRFGDQGQNISYTAQVSAVDGKLQIEGAELSGVPTWIVPTDAISRGIEDGVNTYLAEHNLVVTSVTLQDGSMTLVLADA